MTRLLTLALAAALSASAQVGPSGHWEGTIAVPAGPSKMLLDLAQQSGKWVGSMGVPEKKISGMRVSGLTIQGTNVTFRSPDTPGNPVFRLTWTEGKLVGFMLVPGSELKVELTRTGEPGVVLPEPLSRIPTWLEGDWEGSIPLRDNRTRPVALHFRNNADESASATIDSPAQGMRGALLERIVEDGDSISFAVRIVGGSYKGLRNAEGTEIKGEWTQSGGQKTIPLTLKKK